MKSQIPVSITQIKIPQLSYPSELGSLDFMISTQLCSFQCRSPRLFGYGDKKRIHELRGWVWVNTSFQRNSCFFFSSFGKHFPPIHRSAGNLGNSTAFIVSSGSNWGVCSCFLPDTCGCCGRSRMLFLCFPHSRLRWRNGGFNKGIRGHHWPVVTGHHATTGNL